jgi:DNA-binding TFAR19-related protein (PDSD5 family)
MGARLRGLDEGRKKGDPLRVELDKIRAKLMDLKKLEATNQSSSEEKGSSEQNEVTNDSKQKKRRKILDTNASERMIKSALNGK